VSNPAHSLIELRSNFFFVVGDGFEDGDFLRDAENLRADAGENGAAQFGGQGFRREDTGFFARKKFHELSGDVRGGKRDGRGEAALLANRVERRKENVGTNCEMDVFLCAALDAADDDGRGKPGILQNSLAN